MTNSMNIQKIFKKSIHILSTIVRLEYTNLLLVLSSYHLVKPLKSEAHLTFFY